MAIALTTALAISAAASAGSSAYAAHKQSSAANKAAQLEADAADKAAAVQKEMYERDRADMEPYRQAGAAALGRLGEFSTQPRMTFDPRAQGRLQAPPTPPPGIGGGLGTLGSGGSSGGWASLAGGASSVGGLGARPPVAPPAASPQLAAQNAMVMMQAPDGTPPRPVPPQLVQQYLQRGAKVVG